jgi:hypothetical protein
MFKISYKITTIELAFFIKNNQVKVNYQKSFIELKF